MNCSSCGAPILEASGAGRAVCPYCLSLHQLSPTKDSPDRVIPLDTALPLECSLCHVPLTAAVLENAGTSDLKSQAEAASGDPVAYCPQCHGLLIADVLFSQVVLQRRAAYTGPDQLPPQQQKQGAAAEQQRELDCPHCHKKMETHAYCGPGNPIIDSCLNCGLIWLDAGEMATIERAPGRRTYQFLAPNVPQSRPFEQEYDHLGAAEFAATPSPGPSLISIVLQNFLT